MDPIFFSAPAEFREWLKANHQKEQELWVGYYKKATGKPSMTWSQSVDEALCFGWIDGIRKSVDAESYTIRFTPRRPRSHWSAVNIGKVETLKKLGLMEPSGLKAYSKKTAENSEQFTYEQKNVRLPDEYQAQLKANLKAWEFFESLAPSYKKMSIHWVISAKREETRLRRLGILIESSEEGLKIPLIRRIK